MAKTFYIKSEVSTNKLLVLDNGDGTINVSKFPYIDGADQLREFPSATGLPLIGTGDRVVYFDFNGGGALVSNLVASGNGGTAVFSVKIEAA